MDKIRCPECNSSVSLVIDSRATAIFIRRRRRCPRSHRYTTYEVLESNYFSVTKLKKVRKLLNELGG